MAESVAVFQRAPSMLRVNRSIQIPLSEFTFVYSRSGGPGGQNVNKVNSKATLRWDVARSPALPEGVRARFSERYRRRLTKNGELVLHSQRFRDQERNAADCLERLKAMLHEVATPPRRRKATRPTRSSVEQRLRGKRHAAEKKHRRRKPRTLEE
ncbi:MAG TPA: alternative ribosome rescue aminoacyl-tRNA hydrolase ArfB [Planctomycetaceae bacterium]|nr:alternative ribosome rescue aminoacyl-tRNA hydrolase ArfB [Planctomycetaceae bacterium]